MNFATLKGLTIPEGVVTQITDASGRVIWQKITAGSVIWRPSADISVEHALYPADSTAAYLLINEEVSDGDSTYIWTNGADRISEFLLSGKTPPIGVTITSVTLGAVPLTSLAGSTTISLFIDGEECFTALSVAPDKDTEVSITHAVTLINNYIADNKAFPPIKISVASDYTAPSSKEAKEAGISQVYLVLTYE